MAFILIYVTASSKDEAKKIAHHLLQTKLIACANIFDSVTSIYRWEGKLVEEGECVLVGKTTEANYPKIQQEVEKIHSYSTPCVAKLSVDFNERYAKWLTQELK